ncbi:MAG: ParB N-terminal domain-containing protein [Bacteroidales bacterium]|nr:ParB N-terminal domain-containing protein [Candidatus Colimorpha merdihippi]
MISMQRVALADIRADENNPRKVFSGLDDLAASFDFTPERQGEPMNPIIVAKDGNVFRIIDGERRFRAMKQAGKVDSCLCVVADSMEDADSVAMMLATDNKDRLSEEERVLGVQTMLYLNVDEDRVAALSGRKDADHMKLFKAGRRIRNMESFTPVQMSFDSLLAIGEVNSDEEAAELLELAKDGTAWGSEFQKRKSAITTRQKIIGLWHGFDALFHFMGIPTVEAAPDSDEYKLRSTMFYDEQDAVAKSWDEFGGMPGAVVHFPPVTEFLDGLNFWKVRPKIYSLLLEDEREGSAGDDDEQKIRDVVVRLRSYEDRMQNHLVSLMEEGRLRLMLEGDKRCERLASVIWDEFMDSDVFMCAKEMLDGVEDVPEYSNFVIAYGISDLLTMRSRTLATVLVKKTKWEGAEDAFHEMLDLYELMAPVGYVKSDEELQDVEQLQSVLEVARAAV